MRSAPLVLCVLAGGAAAAPIPARLVYDASGTSCPGKEALITAVARRLGMNPFDNAAASTLMVHVDVAPKGLTATVVRTRPDGSGTGRRELKSANADCVELFETLSLEVALAVDPLAKTTPQLPLPPPPMPVPPPPQLEPPPPPPTTAREPLPPSIVYERGEGPSDTPVSRMTRSALFTERERLDRNRGNSGWPLLIAGMGAVAGGIVLNVAGFLMGSNSPGTELTFHLVGIGAAAAGIVMLTIGIVRRVVFGDRLELFMTRIDEIDARLEEQRRTGWTDPGPPTPQPASTRYRRSPPLQP